LQHAKVFVSVMGTAQEQQACMEGLRHAAGFVQGKLASRLKTRFTPAIGFVLDEGVKKSIEITRLINEALAQHAPLATPGPGEGTEEESTDRNEEGGGE
jgi:ribosome-binding factor A